jgi:hypothetical protein
MTDSDVIILVECFKGVRRAEAARNVDDLIRGECASRCQFLAIRFQPYLGLPIIDLLCL